MDRQRVTGLVLVGVGGFLGAALRYAVTLVVPWSFPVATLVANVGGAFLLGVVLYDERLAAHLSAQTRLLAGAGFCSSLTTYSTFAAETTQLSPQLAAVNVGANYALGFLAIVLGQLVARWAS